MSKLVSVIVPVYNVESYLKECVDSLINQTYKNIEILLIDDGSTDTSGVICDQYIKIDTRVQVKHKKNGGLSDARNTGIDMASGDYIMFVDSDDYVADNYVEIMLNAMVSQQVDIVICGYFLTDECGNVVLKDCNKTKAVFSTEEALRLLLQDKVIKNYAWNKIYKKCYFDKERFPVGRLFEDIFTTYKIFMKCNTIALIPNELYYYRSREGSIMQEINMKREIDLTRAQFERYESLYNIYPELNDELADSTVDAICTTYAVAVKFKANAERKESREYMKVLEKKFNLFKSQLTLKRKLTFLLICKVPLIADRIFARTKVQ